MASDDVIMFTHAQMIPVLVPHPSKQQLILVLLCAVFQVAKGLFYCVITSIVLTSYAIMHNICMTVSVKPSMFMCKIYGLFQKFKISQFSIYCSITEIYILVAKCSSYVHYSVTLVHYCGFTSSYVKQAWTEMVTYGHILLSYVGCSCLVKSN